MRAPRTGTEKLVLGAGLGCLLIPILITVFRPSLDPFSDVNLKLFMRANVNIEVVEENPSILGQKPEEDANISDQTDHSEMIQKIILDGEEKAKQADLASSDAGNQVPNADHKEENSIMPKEDSGHKDDERSSITPKKDENTEEARGMTEENEVKEAEHHHNTKAAEEEEEDMMMIQCDLTQSRSDTCVLHGDVRVHGPSSSITIVADQSNQTIASEPKGWKIRPYARKWEASVMQLIREVSVKPSATPEEAPRCAVRHDVPAVVFSTGGFLGNFFHDFTDVLVPLFITSHRYKGEVQLLVNNFNRRWISKYGAIMSRLSRREIIDLDRDERVHCFPAAHVGLLSHQDLAIDSSRCPGGCSMHDFRELIRECFSLSRRSLSGGGRTPPRLLLIDRKGPRELTNRRQVVALAKSLGYKVVVAGPERTRNVSRFARVVNSCDVLVGVHGAGLTNMVFLPEGAALVQVVPWGGLKYACGHDFGEPAAAMGIRYLEYEIKEEESSLVKQYPRNHPVFTDPYSIHRQGWDALWDVFLNKQTVKLDVRRFKPTLHEALQEISH